MRSLRLTLPIVLFLGMCAVGNSSVHAEEPCARSNLESCSLRELAHLAGIRIGTTLEPFEVSNSSYTDTLLREFNSVTPENALKAKQTQPSRGVFQFGNSDAVIDFAVLNGLEIRGHSLVWSQDAFTAPWVRDITDPIELWTVTENHIREVMGRYSDRVTRWDVVNEPLATFGIGPSESVYWTLGAGWIKRVFELADSIDPDAELWINEYGTDWVGGKHQAFVRLIQNLIADGAPIDGVGIETHRLPGLPLDQHLFEQQLREFTKLGLKVAITELDVPISPSGDGGLEWQAAEFGKVTAACLAVSGCSEITMWGLSDADSWLDDLDVFESPTRPLLFDGSFRPKLAYGAVREALIDSLLMDSLPETGGRPGSIPLIAVVFVVMGTILNVRWRQVVVAARPKE